MRLALPTLFANTADSGRGFAPSSQDQATGEHGASARIVAEYLFLIQAAILAAVNTNPSR